VCFDEGQFRRALGMFQYAARGFRHMGKHDREAEALVNAGYAAGELGLWARSTALLDRAVSLASTTGQYNVLAPAYACRAVASAYNEEFEEATRNIEQSGRLLKGRRDWVATLHLCRAQARVSALSGHWNAAFRAARHGERVAIKVGDLPRVAEFRRLRAAAEERRGRGKAAVLARKSAKKVESLLEGPSPAMRQLGKITPKLAASTLPIFISGESGAGLLDIAREIHGNSPRSGGPLEVVACEHLNFPASDLQGHAEGAWSGALRASVGQVARADGGTLVLDRVDLLSPDAQHVLLRIVEGKIRPVGIPEERLVDIRIIATGQNLTHLLPALRHRLEGAFVRLPELAGRREEIVKTIHDQLAGRRRITADALAELTYHHWKGDLPHLRGVIDRLVALSESSIGRKLVRSVLKTTETRRVATRVDTSRMARLAETLAR
jgi:transcriptional regulator with GAF, ATPase, and Fis domain